VSAADDSWWQRLLKAVQVYFRECYSLRFYWWFYLGTAFYTVGLLCLLTFRIFFARDVGVELEEFGKVESVVFVMGVILYWPLGWLADKIHSLRLIIIAIAMTSVIVFLSSVTIHHAHSYWVYTLLWAAAWIAYSASNAPLFPQILPKDQFGQFASAQAIFNSLATMVASYVGGLFLDYVGSISRANQYRAIYWWAGAFSTLSLICMLMLYRSWCALGGDKSYIAPTIPAPIKVN
jgi:MFS family permease